VVMITRGGPPAHEQLWVTNTEFAAAPRDRVYKRSREPRDRRKSDTYAEPECSGFHADNGRPSLPPCTCVRMLLIGVLRGNRKCSGMRRTLV
jgi:hypothetical protein